MNKRLQLTLYRRNVRRVIVGLHGQAPDFSRGIDRLIDNREAFRNKLKMMEEYSPNARH